MQHPFMTFRILKKFMGLHDPTKVCVMYLSDLEPLHVISDQTAQHSVHLLYHHYQASLPTSFCTTNIINYKKKVMESCCDIRVPAGSNLGNLRPFRDFLRPKLSKFKTCEN